MDMHLMLNIAALTLSVTSWIYAVRSRGVMRRQGIDASEHAARAIAAEKSVKDDIEELRRRGYKIPHSST